MKQLGGCFAQTQFLVVKHLVTVTCSTPCRQLVDLRTHKMLFGLSSLEKFDGDGYGSPSQLPAVEVPLCEPVRVSP